MIRYRSVAVSYIPIVVIRNEIVGIGEGVRVVFSYGVLFVEREFYQVHRKVIDSF